MVTGEQRAMRQGFVLRRCKITEPEWAWVTSFVCDAGGGLFDFDTSRSSRGVIWIHDEGIEGRIERRDGEYAWSTKCGREISAHRGCRSDVRSATIALMTAMFVLRAEKINAKHREVGERATVKFAESNYEDDFVKNVVSVPSGLEHCFE